MFLLAIKASYKEAISTYLNEEYIEINEIALVKTFVYLIGVYLHFAGST